MNKTISFENYKNLFFILYLLTKHSIKYIYYQDSLKFIKDICYEIEKFNVTYIKIIQGICVNSLIFNDKQKNYLLKYTNQVPYTINEKNNSVLNNLEEEGIIFESREPINAGIVALVYKGKYKEKDVAIKVLKNNIELKLKNAIDDLYLFSKLLSYIPFVKNYNINKLIKDNMKVILDQVDFKNEVRSINYWLEFSNKVDYLEVPNVHNEITEKYNNVIVLDFMYGKNLNELTNEEKDKYIKDFVKINFIAAFFYGIGHSDTHSGNIMFLENKIGLIDFGITYKINKEEQEAIYKYYKEIFVNKNPRAAALSTCEVLSYPKNAYNNMNELDKNLLIDGITSVIKKYYYDEPDVTKFIYYCNIVTNKYNLYMAESLNQVMFSISSGINFCLALITNPSSNPAKDYSDICENIVKELLQETEFSLD